MITLPGNVPYALRDMSIDKMDARWRKDFEAEVEDGNFLNGGKSLLLVGPGAEQAAREWLACLRLGGYSAYRTTALEIIRRMDGRAIPGVSDERKLEFEEAECLFIDDFFNEAFMTDETAYPFIWYFRELVRSGAVVVLATSEAEPTIEIFGPIVADIIEETFEVIKHGGSTKAKSKGNSAARGKRIRKDGGASVAGSGTTG